MTTVIKDTGDIFLEGHVQKTLNALMRTVLHSTDKAYGQLVIGKSGVGKTTIGMYLADRLNRQIPQIGEVPVKPALYVKITTLQTPTQFALGILGALNVTEYGARISHQRAMSRLKDLLVEHQVKVIIVDEMQNALPYTAGQRLLEMSKCISEILDDTNIPLILMGTPALKRLLELDKRAKDFQTEEQIARRFRAELVIPPIPFGTWVWLDAINFFMTKFGLTQFTKDDWLPMFRMHLATKGKIAQLEKLISFVDVDVFYTNAPLTALQQAYSEGFSLTGNPFDVKTLSDRALDKYLEQGSEN